LESVNTFEKIDTDNVFEIVIYEHSDSLCITESEYVTRIINALKNMKFQRSFKDNSDGCGMDIEIIFDNDDTLSIYMGDKVCVQGNFYKPKKGSVEAFNNVYNEVVKNIELNADDLTCAKPVIYLYPESETNVDVKLNFNGELTCTYPLYKDGWSVRAMPDGTLYDVNEKEYNYLYWEGESDITFDFSKGFCVEGKETATFLENALYQLGLNRKEANEFIVYWLPMMENNKYNIISFQSESYIDNAELIINPKPDTVIRVYIAWKSSDKKIKLEEQILTTPERNGFTVIEWGGTQIEEGNVNEIICR